MNIIFLINDSFTVEEAWEELELRGITVLYSIENKEDKGELLMGYCEETVLLSQPFKTISSYKKESLPSINWEEQWALHGQNYRDGYVHVKVKDQEILKLKPGPGFGDMSHPTTRLVLTMMTEHVGDRDFLDIGCGSGILGLAAAKLGAKSVVGLDIEVEALQHAGENAFINEVSYVQWLLPCEVVNVAQNTLAVMNMIYSEQEVAWESLQVWHPSIDEMIISGLLQEEESKVTVEWKARGWTIEEKHTLEGWLALRISKNVNVPASYYP